MAFCVVGQFFCNSGGEQFLYNYLTNNGDNEHSNYLLFILNSKSCQQYYLVSHL